MNSANPPPNQKVQTHWRSVQDHARSFWDFTYVYPVISRRSRGLSIGINLNPDKRCNFDCVYCEVDRTTPPKVTRVDLLQIRAELAEMIRLAQSGELGRDPKFIEAADLTLHIRDIAFSGDGEPTMVPDFDDCVRAIVEVKQAHHLDATRIVLITDAAGLDKARVQAGLRLMDAHQGEVWGKLDAGTEAWFRTINRSHIGFERILGNLLLTARERPIIIQSLFLKVHGEKLPDAEIEAYCGRLRDIIAGGGKIREVHAYTVARPTPEAWATRLTPEELNEIGDSIRKGTGLPVECFP